MTGLCGDMNGEHTNDLVTADGCLTTSPELAAESFMINSPGCTKRVNNNHICQKKSTKITKINDIFDKQLVVDHIEN